MLENLKKATIIPSGKKFVMSYSCGKDSALALHKMIAEGNEPLALIVMVNKEMNRSYFHGADRDMLKEYSKVLNIPMIETPSDGADYHTAMEASLRRAMEMGAEYACFGDIDIEGNRTWSEERCKNSGIKAVFPLWKRGREENVRELMGLGYKCLIKSINNTLLPKSLLGRIIDDDTVAIMKMSGIDICGENGEYHTFAVDGPLFSRPLPYKTGEIPDFGDYSVIDVTLG